MDAHADLIPHANWNPICPIIEELIAIQQHPIKNHPILIDDITFITKIPNISKNIMEQMIMSINNRYKINYIDTGGTEVLIASISDTD